MAKAKADWHPRYLVQDKGQLEKLIKDDSELLAHFGASTIGFSPGVVIQVGDGMYASTIELNDAAWNWLRPILVYCKHLEEPEY